MKTTVEIPAELLRKVKAKAAMQGRSMKDLLIEALRDKIDERPRPVSGWRTVFGKAAPASTRDVDRRIRDAERIDPKDWK